MGESLRKWVAVIGGLGIGIGITYLLKTIEVFTISDEMWIGLGVLLSLCVGVSLFFMMKGGG
ncbi:MAG: hypothetical protein QXF35_03150 [Candidatus Bilamarchaeaceae archaeon]